RRRYILRPILPAVITSFAFISIASWQAVILTENIFAWPGLGSLLIKSIWGSDISVITGAIAMFAYLLGFSVLFLDVLYVLVDPRVRIKGGGTT
ncbi:ABC transporter permease subunit, partial [Candidatus Bipolaricaulota bacterium]|nr:ABC transporter permease subunit [Candidatus Bipolaricaulota bacterium]